MSFSKLVITLFLIANPIGNAPGIIALLKDFSFKEQQKILLKESFAAMLLAVFFQFLGEPFMNLLNIQNYTVLICGGTLLFLTAVDMIFPRHEEYATKALKQPPFIVPIATPLISGPGTLTMIMLFSHQEPSQMKLLLAILLAWTAIGMVLVFSPYLQKILKKRGVAALEKLMGLLLILMATDMVQKGVRWFIQTL